MLGQTLAFYTNIFKKCLDNTQKYVLIFRWSCVETGVGFNDPHVSLLIEDFLKIFYDSINHLVQVQTGFLK